MPYTLQLRRQGNQETIDTNIHPRRRNANRNRRTRQQIKKDYPVLRKRDGSRQLPSSRECKNRARNVHSQIYPKERIKRTNPPH